MPINYEQFPLDSKTKFNLQMDTCFLQLLIIFCSACVEHMFEEEQIFMPVCTHANKNNFNFLILVATCSSVLQLFFALAASLMITADA